MEVHLDSLAGTKTCKREYAIKERQKNRFVQSTAMECSEGDERMA